MLSRTAPLGSVQTTDGSNLCALCCFCCNACNINISHSEKDSEGDTELFFFKAVAARDNDKTKADSEVMAS